jgi:hypothetical protein
MTGKRIKNIKKKQRTISIIGASRKLGVTHMCLCLANFISSGLREEVVYLEVCENSQLLGTVGEKLISFENLSAFLFKGVIYVLACSTDDANRIINTYKGHVIVDIHSFDDETKVIFNKCESRIVIGSMKPWCQRDFEDLVIRLSKGGLGNEKFYNKNGRNDEKKAFTKIFGEPIKTLPYIDDPFSLKEKDFDSLIEMIM